MSLLSEILFEDKLNVAAAVEGLRRELIAQRQPRVLGSTLSVEDVCDLLGCKERQVFNLLKRGDLERAPRHGRALRLTKASVERLMQPAPTKTRKRRARAFEPARLEDIPVFKR